jgi:phosphohistidine phosphatase SixA/predicted NUDIX family NTP pyrophosphohydrolase
MAVHRTIRAGGGVVWRRADRAVEIAVVHRPRYDDWSLPKGKLHANEGRLRAAIREVGEELGARVAPGRRLGSARYSVARDGVRAWKSVTYWSMRYEGGSFRPTEEVDEALWLPVSSARPRLSYRGDAEMLDRFTSAPPEDSVVVLVRHARAGKRREWQGDDALRPLDQVGETQARRLGVLLATWRPVAIYAADRTRCIQTVEPLANRLGLRVQVDAALSDEGYHGDEEHSAKSVVALARPDTCVVVCSQGDAIPGLVARLMPGVTSTDTRKAGFWVMSFAAGTAIAADHYDDARRPLEGG